MTERELTPEERDALQAKHERATEQLDRVLAAVDTMPREAQEAILDAAQRILRLAVKAGEHGPMALLLASAQMAVDLNPPPGEEKPAPSPILLPSSMH